MKREIEKRLERLERALVPSECTCARVVNLSGERTLPPQPPCTAERHGHGPNNAALRLVNLTGVRIGSGDAV